jgi:hypothetical protein
MILPPMAIRAAGISLRDQLGPEVHAGRGELIERPGRGAWMVSCAGSRAVSQLEKAQPKRSFHGDLERKPLTWAHGECRLVALSIDGRAAETFAWCLAMGRRVIQAPLIIFH